jgi:spore coat protein U-like protein
MRLAVAFGLCAELWVCGPAFADCGTLTSPMLVTTAAVAFGTYDAGVSGSDTANGSITLDCVLNDTVPSFDAAITTGFASDFTPREMRFLTSTLTYNLYTSGSYGTIWGDGSDSSEVVHHARSAGVGLVTLTVYGAIPGAQFPAPGLYLDSVTVVITY